jgi:hypothetical protein
MPLVVTVVACSRGLVDSAAKDIPDDHEPAPGDLVEESPPSPSPDGGEDTAPMGGEDTRDDRELEVVTDAPSMVEMSHPPDASPPPPDGSASLDLPAAPTCNAGEAVCDGRCVEVGRDPSHCGRCNNACAVGQECLAGVCLARCAPGSTRCGGDCVDLSTDASHCGACGTRCPAGMRCAAGGCVPTCTSGQLPCAGRCVDPTSDPAHCGGCNRPCPPSQRCRAGSCVVTGPGAPCASNADCDATAPRCFPEAIGWQGGYCTRPCSRDDCPAGSLCISDGSASFCLRTCTSASGCRAGYLCRAVGSDSVCYPSCTANPLALCGAAACNAATGICRFVCTGNGDCTAGSTCNTASPRRCVCSAATDCGPGRTCLTRYGYCGCNSDAACGPDALCDPTYGICRPR